MGDTRYYLEYAKINSQQVITGNTKLDGDIEINGKLQAIQKSFVIKHPSKEGWTLHYGSLEGPENGVYVRGRIISDKKISKIPLPDYWIDLIDSNSITVNLTSASRFQRIFVQSTDTKFITIITEEEWGIDVYFTIFAQRKDIPPLEVEQSN